MTTLSDFRIHTEPTAHSPDSTPWGLIAGMLLLVLLEEFLHIHMTYFHLCQDAICSYRFQLTATHLVLRCHSYETNQLIRCWRDILSGVPDDWCALVSCLVWVNLSTICTLPVPCKEPRLWYSLYQPIMVVYHTLALRIWSTNLQRSGTAKAGQNLSSRGTTRNGERQPGSVNYRRHRTCLP